MPLELASDGLLVLDESAALLASYLPGRRLTAAVCHESNAPQDLEVALDAFGKLKNVPAVSVG